MNLNKYAAALLQLAVLVLGAVQVALLGGVDATEVFQLAALTAGAVGTFFLPIVDGKWKGILKTGVALVAAGATALVPLVAPGMSLDSDSVIIVVLAVLNALAVETGVQMRTAPAAPAASPHMGR